MASTESRHPYYPLMDAMRYVLAICIIVSHFFTLNNYGSPLTLVSYYFVAGFFAIAGFVVYPTFERSDSLLKYIRRRARHILPPYFFIVLICAVGFAFISSLSLREYFTSPELYKYLAANLTFLNWLHPSLPGVFDTPQFATDSVNPSLWTMKVDWCLYLSVPLVFGIIRRLRLNRIWVVISLIIFSILYRLGFVMLYIETQKEIYDILARQFFGQMAYFYSGMLIYFYRKEIEKRLSILTIAAGILFILAITVIPFGNIVVCPAALSMLILGISLIKSTDSRWRHRYNFSFEMYLFRAPVIQLAIFFGIGSLPRWQNFAIIFLATIIVSILYKYAFLYLKSLKKA
ncbi:MAG: acyltransferase [Muribaculaceae bacterium]|nr:acyltransferase [Muribaculaceae bacterium]